MDFRPNIWIEQAIDAEFYKKGECTKMSGCEEYEKIKKMIIRAKKDNIETPFCVIDDTIMADNEKAANTLADFLEYFNYHPCTGYYDPEEDARNGEVTESTGLWYVDC